MGHVQGRVSCDMKIAVVGVEYVELSIAMFWRIAQGIIMVGKSGENKQLYLAIQNEFVQSNLLEKNINLKTTLVSETIYRNSECVIIAKPTNYDLVSNDFETLLVESVISLGAFMNSLEYY